MDRGKAYELVTPATVLTVAVGAGLLLPTYHLSAVAMIGAAAAVSSLAIAFHRGVRSAIILIMGAAAFTAPMSGLRVVGLVTLSDVLLAGGAAILVASVSVNRSPKAFQPYRPFMLGTGLIVTGGLIGTAVSDSGFSGIPDLVRFALSTTALLAVVALWAPSRKTIYGLAWMYVVGALVSGVLGLLVISDASGRALGLTGHSNHFGIASMLAGGTAVGLALGSRGVPRVLAVSASIVLVIAVAASGSRAAIGGSAAFAVAYFLMTRDWRVVRWGSLGCAVLLLLITIGAVRVTETSGVTRLVQPDETVEGSNRARSEARDYAIAQVKSSPFLGVGFTAARDAHDVYLQVWAASGLLGIGGLLLIVRAVVGMMRSFSRYTPLAAAMLSAYVGYLVAAAFSTILWERYLWLHVALTIAMFTALDRRTELEVSARSEVLEDASTEAGRSSAS